MKGSSIGLWLLFSVGVHVLSCSETPPGDAAATRKNGYTPDLKTREDSLLHDVMQAHDEAMARMAKLSKHLGRIQARIDSLPSRLRKSAEYLKWQEIKHALEEAEHDMNQWMKEFAIDSLKEDKENRMRYLSSEKIKIKAVKEKIISHLARADSLLFPKKP